MDNENKSTNKDVKKPIASGKTKKCKHCQSEISAKAQVCPNCRKKQKPKGCLPAVLAVFVLIVLIALFSNPGDDTKEVATNTQGTEENKEEAIVYTAYSVSEMMEDLESNALKAEKKYADQYVEITGKLSTIDSSGKYISLLPSDEDFAIIGVQCYIKTDEQTDKVLEMTSGDTVTLKGKIKSVGEIFGYSLDIDEIK